MPNKPLEQELASRLRNSEEQVDAEALSALATARQRALEAGKVHTRSDAAAHWQGWLLAASVAVVALLVAWPAKQSTPIAVPEAEAMALEEGPHEDPELFENLEFYEWLADQEDLG